jgi:hypothetical protein
MLKNNEKFQLICITILQNDLQIQSSSSPATILSSEHSKYRVGIRIPIITYLESGFQALLPFPTSELEK